jgi:adenosine deaminase CECR1
MANNHREFLRKRESIFDEVTQMNRSSVLKFTAEEQQASDYLETLKKEIHDKKEINLMENLYDNLPKFKQTKLYKVLLGLPKGVLQHMHLPAAMSFKTFMKAFSFNEKIFYSVSERQFKLFAGGEIETGYRSMAEFRESDGEEAVEQAMKDLLFFKHKEMQDFNVEQIFKDFESRFMSMGDAFYYEPVLKAVTDGLYDDLREDGIDAVEIRSIFGWMINENKEKASFDQEFEFLKNFREKCAKADQSVSIGYIHTGIKSATLDTELLKKWFEVYGYSLTKKNEDIFIGFDMVAYEGNKLYEFMAKDLYDLKMKHPGTNFIFHSGENVLKISKNIIDAVLLGSKRLGHGLAVVKSPVLIDLVKKHDVCIETNPISNYMLGYARDPFGHPLRMLINSGVACTINSDDPLFWDCPLLSMDYFVATLFCDLTLKEIKWLVLNSITYSYFSRSEKKELKRKFEDKWEVFVGSLLQEHQNTFAPEPANPEAL